MNEELKMLVHKTADAVYKKVKKVKIITTIMRKEEGMVILIKKRRRME